jgi:uncharacterized protein YndB with AHSA1/START domain
VPAEAVFDAWLDPATVREWLAGAVAESAGGVLERVEIDARVDGGFIFTDLRNGEEAVHHGTYLELDRPHRLAFTWLPELGDDAPSIVTIDIEPTAKGCRLTLVHTLRAEWADFVERTTNAWATWARHIATVLG